MDSLNVSLILCTDFIHFLAAIVALEVAMSVGRSVCLSVGRSVAEGSEHATYGDRPCFYTQTYPHLSYLKFYMEL